MRFEACTAGCGLHAPAGAANSDGLRCVEAELMRGAFREREKAAATVLPSASDRHSRRGGFQICCSLRGGTAVTVILNPARSRRRSASDIVKAVREFNDFGQSMSSSWPGGGP